MSDVVQLPAGPLRDALRGLRSELAVTWRRLPLRLNVDPETIRVVRFSSEIPHTLGEELARRIGVSPEQLWPQATPVSRRPRVALGGKEEGR